MIDYSAVWTEIVSYIWRTHQLDEVTAGEEQEPEAGSEGGEGRRRGGEDDGEAEGESEGTIKGKKPAYRLTAKQIRWLAKVKGIIGDVEEEADEDEIEEGIEEESEDEESDDEESEEEWGRLEDRVLAFLLALLDHEFKDNEYKSALISAAAVLGLNERSHW